MKNTLTILCAVAALLSAGCGSPAVVQLTPDLYVINKANRAGVFENLDAIKAAVFKEANDFAAAKGKVALAVAVHDAPEYPGHCATVEYQFRLVDKDSPEASAAH